MGGDELLEQTPALVGVDESSFLCPDQKAWGAACFAATRPLACCFLLNSLRGRGSKLIAVSFPLQSPGFLSVCVCECVWGGFPAVGRKTPPSPPSFLFDSLQTPASNKEAGWSCHFQHIFYSTRVVCWSSHVAFILTSQLHLKCFTFVFYKCFLRGVCFVTEPWRGWDQWAAPIKTEENYSSAGTVHSFKWGQTSFNRNPCFSECTQFECSSYRTPPLGSLFKRRM